MTRGSAQPPALALEGLTVGYREAEGDRVAVRDVSLAIGPGDCLALVGESGSGKSTIAFAILRVLAPTVARVSGRIWIAGRDVMRLSPAELEALRGGRVSFVPQDPMTSLNPSQRVGRQIAEAFGLHLGLGRRRSFERALRMLERVRMPDPEATARRYPFELSGGQQQRVLIAMAFGTEPDLLILDEPTTALDVTTEARILELIGELQADSGTALLFISHNMAVVRKICRSVAVIYAGEIVEAGPAAELFRFRSHPYTRGLLASIPGRSSSARRGPLPSIPGFLPDPARPPKGCVFEPRCFRAEPRCRESRPDFVPVLEARLRSRCFFAASLVKPEHGGATPRAADSGAGPAAPEAAGPILSVVDLVKTFRRGRQPVRALDGVSIACGRGEILGIVGESGSGKTTLARCVAGLTLPDAGHVRFDGIDVWGGESTRRPDWRRRLQIVFQNPEASLNAQKTVGEMLARPIQRFGLASRRELPSRIAELLAMVKLDRPYAERYPHELSGGERQRVAIARALATEPALIVCDEPMSSLDVSIQAGIINLLAELRAAKGISILFISHDLNVVRHLSDRIAVLQHGRVWETATPEILFKTPGHPYTEALLAALPLLESGG